MTTTNPPAGRPPAREHRRRGPNPARRRSSRAGRDLSANHHDPVTPLNLPGGKPGGGPPRQLGEFQSRGDLS
jgi:hypothetical protein